MHIFTSFDKISFAMIDISKDRVLNKQPLERLRHSCLLEAMSHYDNNAQLQ